MKKETQKSVNKKILGMVAKAIEVEVDAGWPGLPPCTMFLHQPKRPKKRED